MEEWRPWAAFGELEKSTLNATSLCIMDETECDALPLMHTLLGQALKRDGANRVVLITLQRPVREFVRTSRRLGYDLSLVSMQGRLVALDAVGGTAGPKFHGLDILASRAEDGILEKVSAFGPTATVFIDGLDALCTIAGWPLARAMRLIKDLERLSRGVVCRLTTSPSVERLARWLVHRSELVMICRGLASTRGASTVHAHGQVIVYLLGSNGIATQSPSLFLFKCTDAALLLQNKFIDPSRMALEEVIKL